MTPQELKNSILQLAIQSKLVEQRQEEGSSEELLQKIHEERQSYIKAGKIKKGKAYPPITESELSVEIPETWSWTRLQNIVYNRGQAVPSEKFCYIDIGSIDNKHQKLNKEDNVLDAAQAPSRARKILCEGQAL